MKIKCLIFFIVFFVYNSQVMSSKNSPYHHLSDGTFRNPEGSPKRDINFKWSFKIFNKEKKKLDMTIPEDHVVKKEKVLSDLAKLKNGDYIIDISDYSNYPILFFENVTGIISSKLSSDWGNDVKGTPVLLHVLREMERMGYHATWCRTAASIYGASHKRTRVFIMGVSRSLPKDQLDIVSERVESYVHTPTKYPAPRGQEQYDWEAPRMVERNLADPNHLQIAHYPKESLKLIGNGVVPDCASGSFVRCWEKVLKYVDRT